MSFHTIHNEPEKDGTKLDKLVNKICFKFLRTVPVALYKEMIEKINLFYGVDSTVFVRNGIDLSRFENRDRNKVRSELRIPEDAFVAGHIGRFSQQKNHDFLMDIFYEIVEKEENAYLLLVGDGPLRSEVEAKADQLKLRDRVKFLGLRSDVPDVLATLDSFIFPSLYEGLSVTLVEAQAAGVRCIISDTINRNSLLTDDIVMVGLKESPKVWANVVLNRSIMGKAYDCLDKYRIEKVMDDLYNLYIN
jgi:glycosyltransferase involved in cell wall biosynthesis